MPWHRTSTMPTSARCVGRVAGACVEARRRRRPAHAAQAWLALAGGRTPLPVYRAWPCRPRLGGAVSAIPDRRALRAARPSGTATRRAARSLLPGPRRSRRRSADPRGRRPRRLAGAGTPPAGVESAAVRRGAARHGRGRPHRSMFPGAAELADGLGSIPTPTPIALGCRDPAAGSAVRAHQPEPAAPAAARAACILVLTGAAKRRVLRTAQERAEARPLPAMPDRRAAACARPPRPRPLESVADAPAPRRRRVTARIVERSRRPRADYLARMDAARDDRPGARQALLRQLGPRLRRRRRRQADAARAAPAPTSASSPPTTTCSRRTSRSSAIPTLITQAAREVGATPRSPAACRPCATASPRAAPAWSCRCSAATSSPWRPRSSLTHDAFDAALLLGVCDKIVPGLFIGALTLRPPAGRLRARRADALGHPQRARRPASARVYAEGKVDRDDLLDSESGVLPLARHLHLLRHRQLQPDDDGADGPAPAGHRLRPSGHAAARRPDRGRGQARVRRSARTGNDYRPMADVIDEKAIVNAIVGLLATGGSTNHAMHLVAMARAAGVADRLERHRRAVAR